MATTTIPANCAAVTNALLAESGRFGPGIFARAARKRPIIRLMSKTRGAWANGMGISIAAVTFERSLPDTFGGKWANIAVSDGDSVNACLPPTDTAAFGTTTRNYQPQHMAINSDHFCIRDIQFDWQYAEMLSKITAAFSDISEWTWASRYTSEYVRLAGHHLTLNNTHGVQDDATGYNTTNLPTSILTQGVLDDIYMDLYREGADLASGLAEDTNEAVFTVITSSEVLKQLLLDNPELRADKRFAYMGKGDDSPLAIGMPTKRRIYGNYIFEIDPYPRKFVFSGGAYVEVAPFVKTATTKGYKQNLNPAYKAAPYVETIIWHESNYQSLAVNTITNPAPGWNFTPRSWMGEFSPRNILHETCNPDGTIIFWRALFGDASKPINPYVGYSILSLSCPIAADLKDCNGYTT
jgi:hypothetical protein